jgi:death-on-curing family protein
MNKDIIIYQGSSGEIALKGDVKRETVWASQAQIADLFGVDRTVVTKHIKNILSDQELDEKLVCANFAHTTKHGAIPGKTQKKEVTFYNLDVILAVGYRTNSAVAIKFRQWATKTLREHIIKGYTINRKRIAKNYDEFLQAVESVQKLLPAGEKVKAQDALELVKLFASTWLSLDAYDKSQLPKTGASKKQVLITAEELTEALKQLKADLLKKQEASELFGQERNKDAIAGIVGTVFQSVFGRDAYETLEEKAAHLLYFIVKNHPFVDGNKRSGAFAFVWFLNKAGLLRKEKISPEALTALTLLVAESKPQDKERVIGLILQLLKE